MLKAIVTQEEDFRDILRNIVLQTHGIAKNARARDGFAGASKQLCRKASDNLPDYDNGNRVGFTIIFGIIGAVVGGIIPATTLIEGACVGGSLIYWPYVTFKGMNGFTWLGEKTAQSKLNKQVTQAIAQAAPGSKGMNTLQMMSPESSRSALVKVEDELAKARQDWVMTQKSLEDRHATEIQLDTQSLHRSLARINEAVTQEMLSVYQVSLNEFRDRSKQIAKDAAALDKGLRKGKNISAKSADTGRSIGELRQDISNHIDFFRKLARKIDESQQINMGYLNLLDQARKKGQTGFEDELEDLVSQAKLHQSLGGTARMTVKTLQDLQQSLENMQQMLLMSSYSRLHELADRVSKEAGNIKATAPIDGQVCTSDGSCTQLGVDTDLRKLLSDQQPSSKGGGVRL